MQTYLQQAVTTWNLLPQEAVEMDQALGSSKFVDNRSTKRRWKGWGCSRIPLVIPVNAEQLWGEQSKKTVGFLCFPYPLHHHWRLTAGLENAVLCPTVAFSVPLEVLFIAQTTTKLGLKTFTPENSTSKTLYVYKILLGLGSILYLVK